MRHHLLVFTAVVRLINAARVCGNSTSTFPWRIGDVRFDGSDPSKNRTYATVAASITPAPRGTLFECVSQWPEAWAGWYEGSKDIIWSDCIWTGNGGTSDRTISFGLDWKAQMFYLSHTFDCSDAKGYKTLALGSTKLNLNCTAPTDGARVCDLASPSGINMTTTSSPVVRNATETCISNSRLYQSWEISKWHRQYELAPGSTDSPRGDTGPSFLLSSMSSTNVLNCTSTGQQKTVFEGSCTSTAGPSISGKFKFDVETDMLTVTQHSSCGSSLSYDTLGVGYVQSRCDRSGKMLTCTLDPVWIGTKTW